LSLEVGVGFQTDAKGARTRKERAITSSRRDEKRSGRRLRAFVAGVETGDHLKAKATPTP
jgi:hypothetical protein